MPRRTEDRESLRCQDHRPVFGLPNLLENRKRFSHRHSGSGQAPSWREPALLFRAPWQEKVHPATRSRPASFNSPEMWCWLKAASTYSARASWRAPSAAAPRMSSGSPSACNQKCNDWGFWLNASGRLLSPTSKPGRSSARQHEAQQHAARAPQSVS